MPKMHCFFALGAWDRQRNDRCITSSLNVPYTLHLQWGGIITGTHKNNMTSDNGDYGE